MTRITTEILHREVDNKPTRFDMAINFFCCIKKDNKNYLVAYYYNPAWDLYYPFYDDVNKTPIIKQSNVITYKELINETNQVLKIDLDEKLNLAHKRFVELIGCKCKIKQSKIKELFELKYSKTANVYTVYKLFNYIATDVNDLQTMLNPKSLECKLIDLDNLDNNKLVDNAIWFCSEAKEELKQYSIKYEGKI